MPRRTAPLLALIACLAAAPVRPAPQAESAEAQLDAARRALAQQRYGEAIRAFRAADKLVGGRCGDCQLGLAKALKATGDFRGALAAAAAAVEHAADDFVRADAENERGLALLALSDKHPEYLEEAAGAFRRVLDITRGHANAARVNLAEALLRLRRDEEAKPLLAEYLAREPEGPSADRARELLGNPGRARQAFVPDFALDTLRGEIVRNETYAGKVLLLDFWATWCGPCVAAVPSLSALHAKFTAEPFALVSVSVDRQLAPVERFVARHKMDWTQVWDGEGAFTARCGVGSFPTYLLVDHTGAIVFRKSGWGPGAERELRRRIADAVAAAKAATAPAVAR